MSYPTTPPSLVADIPFTPQNWRVGDILIGIAGFMALDQIPETVTLDLGHYRVDTGTRFPRIDGSGDSVRISDVPRN